MKALYPSLLALAVGLVGCSTTEVPVTTSFPRTSQNQMQAAKHWGFVANDVAARLQTALLSPDSKQRMVLHVEPHRNNSTFSRAFHEMLVTALLQHGFGVTEDRSQGLPLSYDIQPVAYADRGAPPAGPGSYGDHEVIVTTSVMSGNRYLARLSDVYYVNDNNFQQYLTAYIPSTKLIEVVGNGN
ncbi:MAG TPA: hypothetical protein VNN09_14255 [Candidatus Competibacteraceae bacterium]|nr:hypothetical protein [Candidatus Competibacteraceae bacterium]